ncbi:hypothetical protein COV05_01305 [Candidatus Uhrbacteria bacterium CG10_big_fil_rev_8_21_14_0_10_48_16]|uniref:Uncharacterized protein n=1 Tax=Candidatus Uhrbacteria bacterium CG10_big_fil_rev_8_21_14_0_10_48_16 TaxID=1975038 RepID=A0A2M8LHW6_9BACT|nr:MAG: hypothetical protein COV05_01305 [Candidatus Uhrbacteria bacterium CG10_big_fil_rev_8_21_14_0_10_48_16]
MRFTIAELVRDDRPFVPVGNALGGQTAHLLEGPVIGLVVATGEGHREAVGRARGVRGSGGDHRDDDVSHTLGGFGLDALGLTGNGVDLGVDEVGLDRVDHDRQGLQRESELPTEEGAHHTAVLTQDVVVRVGGTLALARAHERMRARGHPEEVLTLGAIGGGVVHLQGGHESRVEAGLVDDAGTDSPLIEGMANHGGCETHGILL